MASQEKNSNQQISFNRKVNNLAELVATVVTVMKADYISEFNRQFKSPEDLRDFKNRLYTKIRKFDHKAIIDGYERYAAENPNFMPGVQKLVFYMKIENDKILRKQQEQLKAIEKKSEKKITRHINLAEMLKKKRKSDSWMTTKDMVSELNTLISKNIAHGTAKTKKISG